MDHRRWRAFVSLLLFAKMRAAGPEVGTCATRLDDGDANIEGRKFLTDGIKEAFQAPFARMVQRPAGKRRLATECGQTDDPAASLCPQMRQRCPNQRDWPQKIC